MTASRPSVTFLTSNEDKPWWLLWLFAGGIMAVVVTMGYMGLGEHLGGKGGDLTFGKFAGLFQDPDNPIAYPKISFWYVLPPLVLLGITRLGIPVSTTFLVLTFFAPKALPKMLVKSLGGYGVAFLFAIAAFMVLSRLTERYFLNNPMEEGRGPLRSKRLWTVLQWMATGFLWSQWLTTGPGQHPCLLGRPSRCAAMEIRFCPDRPAGHARLHLLSARR